MAVSSQPKPVSAGLEALVMRHVADVEAGNIEAARDSIGAVMDFVMQEASEEPPDDLIRSLMADKAINQGEWNVAAKYHSDQLSKARAESNANARASGEAHSLLRLAAIEYWQGNAQAAYERATEGLKAARKSEWDFILVYTLEPFARIAVRTGHFEEAIRAADEGLERLEDCRMNDVMRAMLILCRCDGLLGLGRPDQLQSGLETARKLLQPLSVIEDASGVQATLGRWWRLEAHRLSKEGDWVRESQAWENAIGKCRQVAEQWDCDDRGLNAALARALTEFAVAADQHGDDVLATQLRFERWQVCRANPGLA